MLKIYEFMRDRFCTCFVFTSGQVDNKAVESSAKALETYANTDGFSEEELSCIANAICNGNFSEYLLFKKQS